MSAARRHNFPPSVLVAAWFLALAVSNSVRAAAPDLTGDLPPVQILQTPDGARFGLFGPKPVEPAPTLFVFATAIEEMHKSVYLDVGRRLASHGFLTVALDPPCHGADVRPGEPPALNGWRARLEKGEQLVEPFTARASKVLDYLIKEGYTDPKQVIASGTSRGGFLAFHFAAADPRVAAVAAISPVTTLRALSEFRAFQNPESIDALDLANLAPKLAGRPAWVSIGNNDPRVSTDDAIALTRKLVAAGLTTAKPPIPVELIVGPSSGHANIERAYDLAAEWLLRKMHAKADFKKG